MPQDYLTMTPGSAVADKLQEILTSKRLEARQAQQDALKQKEVESEIASRASLAKYHESTAASLAEDRLERADSRKALARERNATLYTPGQALGPGDAQQAQAQGNGALINQGIDPETSAMRGLQIAAPPTAPGFDPEASTPTSVGQIKTNPIVPRPATWIGTQGQQEKQTKDLRDEKEYNDKLAAMKLLQTPGATDGMDPVQVDGLYHRAYGVNAGANVVAPKGNRKVWVLNEADGKLYDSSGKLANQADVGPNDTIERRSRPPVGAQRAAPPTFEGVGPDGKTKVIFQLDPTQGMVPVKVPAGYSIGGKTGTVSSKVPTSALYDPKAFNTLQSALRSKGVAGKRSLDSAKENFINSVDPTIRGDVQAVARHEAEERVKNPNYASVPFDQLVSSGSLTPLGNTPEEQQEYFDRLRRVLAALRGID